ncbi:MAG: hypothetical protein OXI54_14805 [Chloroflexota bacterium]|nr:hypothetical protein [Chloroflexota bacterium]MDE2685397.1 hypothetical protein [Chloroflexota bacterium]
MPPADSRYRQRAERHRDRAISYRDDANLLLTQYNKPDSAGALLYEAAKQCINAVSNRNGQNPGATGSKTRYLESIASQPPGDGFDLAVGWEAAMRLHIHADREHLSDADFQKARMLAQNFIDDMLAIYASGG